MRTARIWPQRRWVALPCSAVGVRGLGIKNVGGGTARRKAGLKASDTRWLGKALEMKTI